MPTPNRTQLADLRGVTRMAIDASAGVADIVERMHRTIQLRPGPLGAAATDTTRGITGFVYRSVRGGMRLVRGSRQYRLLDSRDPDGLGRFLILTAEEEGR